MCLGHSGWINPSKATHREWAVSLIKPMLPFVCRESIHLRGTPASDQSMTETAEEITSGRIASIGFRFEGSRVSPRENNSLSFHRIHGFGAHVLPET